MFMFRQFKQTLRCELKLNFLVFKRVSTYHHSSLQSSHINPVLWCFSGSFLGVAPTDHRGSLQSLNSTGSDEKVYEDGKIDGGDHDDANFHEMLDHVGAKEVFDE